MLENFIPNSDSFFFFHKKLQFNIKLKTLQNAMLTPESFLFMAWRWSMNVASGGRLDILLVFLEQKQEFIIHENITKEQLSRVNFRLTNKSPDFEKFPDFRTGCDVRQNLTINQLYIKQFKFYFIHILIWSVCLQPQQTNFDMTVN